MYLMSVHLIGVSHWRVPHERTSHWHAPHRRVLHGRALHRRTSHKHVPHERASHGVCISRVCISWACTSRVCIDIAACVLQGSVVACVATNQILYQMTGSLPPLSNTLLGSSSPSDSSSASSSLRGACRGYCLRNSDSSRTLNVSGSSLAF